MNVKLTRRQELVLISMGMQALIDKAIDKVTNSEAMEIRAKAAKASWTPERRKKFADTMKRKFANRKLKVGDKHKETK